MQNIGMACGVAVVCSMLCVAAIAENGGGRVDLGNTKTLDAWKGLTARQEGGEIAASGEASFEYPAGPKGWYQHGFRLEHDGTRDWRGYFALQLQLTLLDDKPCEITMTISLPPQRAREAYLPSVSTKLRVAGRGEHRLTVPWHAFDFPQAQPMFLKYVRELRVKSSERVVLRGVRLVAGEKVAISAEVRGKSAPRGGVAEYVARVTNCTDQAQAITLSQVREGWEAMKVAISPESLDLAPGASGEVKVRVTVPGTIPPAGHESQRIQAIANGDGAASASITFVTASHLDTPSILHTPQRWQEVRDKVAKYPEFRKAADEYIARAQKWRVPEIAKAPKNLTGVDDMGPFIFATTSETDLMASGIAYQLTGREEFAQKVRTYVLRLSDPRIGYPATLRGCNQSLVQEGHYFQHIAMAYDMVRPAGIFSEAERQQIERTFRLFMQRIDGETSMGAINNWNLSEICGAMYCALAIEDMSMVNRFFAGPGGVRDQLAHGVLDDGWWYECAISYNVWCTTEFTQAALALEPWGINFRDMNVPTGYSRNYSLRPFDNVDGLYGQSFQKWGPITRPYVNIRRMWDALPRFVDFRGVMFGVNDATERPVGGEAFDIAYYVYRDPVYAALVKQGGGKRDLLYGVPELPQSTPELFRDSAYADNVGVAMLRSRAEGKGDRERIQAVLHYGTHGGFHGHFDRTGLLHLSRYGRSFYNPEMVWYSYAPFMYKFYVQNSTSKNMVVVDRKMQEPVESQRLLFHTGKLMQATAVQTKARWSTPPYGGMLYPEQGYKTLHEKAFAEGRFLPVPEKMPEYGSVSEFTEPILQRRVMVVTDDYVLLADYLKGERPHTFESLLQMKGFGGIEGARAVRHDAQWDTNPILDAQFVTDCNWYEASAPAKASFVMRWGPGADNEGTRALESTDGVLKLDVHTLWPAKQELMVGTTPEAHPVEKRLLWNVRGDGKTLAEGKFGAWILGKDEIDVPVAGIRQLDLETRVEASKKPTIFWGNPRLVMADGREIPLSDASLKCELDNVLPSSGSDRDYFGGPIKIVGTQYKYAVAAQPKDDKSPAHVRVDIGQLKASRFRATIGGDYPLGDESQRRKTYASKVNGTEARFLTLIEPFEDRPMVRRAEAIGADELKVELNDGRTQVVRFENLSGDGSRIKVTIEERRGGNVVRTETSGS